MTFGLVVSVLLSSIISLVVKGFSLRVGFDYCVTRMRKCSKEGSLDHYAQCDHASVRTQRSAHRALHQHQRPTRYIHEVSRVTT